MYHGDRKTEKASHKRNKVDNGNAKGGTAFIRVAQNANADLEAEEASVSAYLTAVSPHRVMKTFQTI